MVLRLETRDFNGEACVYDGIVEENSDLDALSAGTATYHGRKISPVAEGSAMFSLEDKKTHVKMTDGTWEAGT